MKDWKTYAIIILAIWCSVITFRKPESEIIQCESVDRVLRTVFYGECMSCVLDGFYDGICYGKDKEIEDCITERYKNLTSKEKFIERKKFLQKKEEEKNNLKRFIKEHYSIDVDSLTNEIERAILMEKAESKRIKLLK